MEDNNAPERFWEAIREHIPRKQPVVACRWVHPVLLGSLSGASLEGMLRLCARFWKQFFLFLLSFRNYFKNVTLERKKSNYFCVKNRGCQPQMLSLCQLSCPPSFHICDNLFQFNSIAHFSSVAVTLNGTDFSFYIHFTREREDDKIRKSLKKQSLKYYFFWCLYNLGHI